MSKTKVEHVDNAYQAMRISGLTVKANPEEIELALTLLEDMMHEFKSRNICSNYVFEDSINPNTDSRINPAYNNATASCLAVRLCHHFGKEVPNGLQMQANQGLSNWSARSGRVNQVNPSNRMPRGSGNTFRFSNWVRYYRFDDNAPISCETIDLKVDEIDSFVINFGGYLNAGETITSYTLDVSDGIQVLSDSNTTNTVTLECKGLVLDTIQLK